jgi:putative FmdB family regulatory protein
VPVYEYECVNCGEKTQRLQKAGEDSSGSRCLTCGMGILRKVFSPFAGGWRETGSCDSGRSRFT